MNALERSHHELKKLKMMSRCQRFLARVRGTQLLIFLIILGYDLYPYAGMVQAGLMWFVAMVVPPGILIGTMVTRWLARSPGTLIKLMNAAGYATMAIFLLTRGANILFPFWVYAAGHALQWFWLTTFFLHASRPYDFSSWFEGSDEDAEPEPRLAWRQTVRSKSRRLGSCTAIQMHGLIFKRSSEHCDALCLRLHDLRLVESRIHLRVLP